MASKSKRAKSEDGEESKPSTALGIGCLILFAAPFALIGAGALAGVVIDLATWRAAQQWVETPATLLASKLETEHDDDGDPTYRITVSYAYEYQGKRHTGERVTLQGGSDNVGSYYQVRAEELEQILKAGGQTVCFVDPDSPAQAMLYRDLRIGLLGFKMMFAVIFGGMGFGLLAACIYGYRKTKREEILKTASPTKPWMWRDDWAAGLVRSSEGKAAWFIGFFALIWNVMVWPVMLAVWTSAKGGNGPPLLLVALFPAAGVGMALWAGYLWLRRFRWGVSKFEMAAVPGVIGGPLAGVIHAPGGIVPEDGFLIQLVCMQHTTEGDSTTEKALWQTEQTIYRDLATVEGNRTLIPVKFIVPYEVRPTGEDITWKVVAKAATFGVDYLAEFEVPVFMTPASSPKIGQALAVKVAAAEEPPVAEGIAATVARMNAVLEEELPTSRTIRFPAWRNRGMATFSLMFVVVWTAIGCALFLTNAPRIVPCGVLALALMSAFAALRNCLSSTRLEYGPRGITYSHRMLGFGRERETPRDQITNIVVANSGSTSGNTALSSVTLVGPGGKQTVVSEIARRIDAESLAADMRRILTLDDNSDGTDPEMPLESDLPQDFLKD